MSRSAVHKNHHPWYNRRGVTSMSLFSFVKCYRVHGWTKGCLWAQGLSLDSAWLLMLEAPGPTDDTLCPCSFLCLTGMDSKQARKQYPVDIWLSSHYKIICKHLPSTKNVGERFLLIMWKITPPLHGLLKQRNKKGTACEHQSTRWKFCQDSERC